MIQLFDKIFLTIKAIIIVLYMIGINGQENFDNNNEKQANKEGGHINRKENTISTMIASMMENNIDGSINLMDFKLNKRKTKFDWSINLDNSNKYKLNWNFNYTQNEIKFALNINKNSSTFRIGLDIFAIGFSENGKLLSSSDFCLFWFDLSHNIHLQDARTNSQNILELIDESESYCKLLSSTFNVAENNLKINKNHPKRNRNINRQNQLLDKERERNEIEIEFMRPLDVCNSIKEYYIIDNGTTNIVWFTVKGPLLTIDGLNLTKLVYSNSNNIKTSQFEFGMNRVQLIANKPLQVFEDDNINYSQKEQEKDYKQFNNNNVKSHTIKMNNFTVPAKETTYWCKLFKLPKKFHSKKFHITKYEPSIDFNNKHLVHHMELFNCANLNKKQLIEFERLFNNNNNNNKSDKDEVDGWQGECGDFINRPKITQTCKKVIMAWAMGAHPLEYPNLVGQLIGGENYSPFVMLEIHYNNVKKSDGFIDSSGLKFYYTNKLRPFEAGILEVGLEYTDKYAIPPNLIMPLAGYCVSECTRVGLISSSSTDTHDEDNDENFHSSNNYDDNNNNKNNKTKVDRNVEFKSKNKLRGTYRNINSNLSNKKFNNKKLDDGIYIFAAQLHTHLTGISSWTEHIREGKLLGELQRDNHYSPHFQEIRYLSKPVHVAPGDALIHYCLYNTKERLNVTLGGEATSDEMCVTYIHYYPRIDLEVCKSSVDSEALEKYFSSLAKEENQNTSNLLRENHLFLKNNSNNNNNNNNKVKTVNENYHSIEWNRKRSEELIQFYSNSPLSIQCNKSNGDRFPGYWNGIMPTEILDYDSKLYNSNNNRALSGKELISYRGVGARRRHALCENQ